MNYLFLFFGAFQIGRVFNDFQMSSVATDTAIAFGIGAILLFVGWRGMKKQNAVVGNCDVKEGVDCVLDENDDTDEQTGVDGITFKENGVRFL